MNYLLVNHIAARPGRSPGELVFPRAWYDDLIAQSNALAQHNIRLIVATPIEERAATSDAVSITPDLAGFEHLPIPGYKSARQFLRSRVELMQVLTHAIAAADIIQFDIGGHPLTPAVIGEPIARLRHKPIVWVFGNENPIPALRRANADRHTTKRLAGHGLNLRMESFLRESIAHSEVVFTHGPNVLDELALNCNAVHLIDRLNLSDQVLMSAEKIQARRAHLLDNSQPLIFQVKAGNSFGAWGEHALRAIAHVARLHVSARMHLCVNVDEFKPIQSRVIELKLAKIVTIDTKESSSADIDLEPSPLPAEDTDLSRSVALGRAPIAYRSGATDSLGTALTRIQRHDERALAHAMLEASVDRPALVRRMLDGLFHAKASTIEASHRRRASI
ncbi:MAG TPA: hypothetical protein PK402_04655, partial [Tepidisphaeraceae bacterium]|nr:hypothetical protein [Tepidisphaeraceae bacterium]